MNYPARLDWLIEMAKRTTLSKEMANELYRLKAGFEGEQYVLESLKKFGEPHWTVRSNMWFDYNGYFECDLVVLTNAGLYTFEMKNYTGHFECKNMQCSINGESIGFNPINQAQYTYTNFQKLIHSEMPSINVYGSIVFAGEHNIVEVHDTINGVQIVLRSELRNYIWKMKKDERNHRGPIVNTKDCMTLFEQYTTENRFVPEPITPDTQIKLRKGICCSYCNRFDLTIGKVHIRCQCGMQEPRENAIVRTICEYGVIHFDKDLVTSDIYDFFDGQISYSNVYRYLKKHFKMQGAYKTAVFINPCEPIKSIYPQFAFEKSRVQEIKGYG